MDVSFDYNSLHKRFCKTKSELDETTITLDKLKTYENCVPSKSNWQVSQSMERNSFLGESSTIVKQEELSSLSGSEKSESDSEHPSKKVAIQSAVIPRIESSKTRKKFIHTYNSDNKVQLRNRRFLGMVQNTLRSFQDEEVKRHPQDSKRKRALEKVEAAAEEERILLQRQKTELYYKSRKQWMELECLEKMMRIAESFEFWENNQKYLLNYVATKTRPRIFFLPHSHSFATKKQHERTRMEIIEKIKRQKTFVKGVLSRISQSYDLSMPVCTEETCQVSEADNTQYVSRTETTEEEIKKEEILHLDISDNEAEDFD